MPHISWTEIKNFHNLRKSMQVDSSTLLSQTITYKAKVKLHGTNAAIRIDNGVVTAQSRERDLSIDNDNCGFARWLESCKEQFLPIPNSFAGENVVLIHGEWAGSGVQKEVAISKIPNKIFAVFAIQVISSDTNFLFTSPYILSQILPDVDGVHVIPWYYNGKEYKASILGDALVVEKQIEGINTDVLSVEKCDPFVQSIFGIEGVGEGLVLYPILNYNSIPITGNYDLITNNMFKAKGEKHQVVASTRAVQVDATKAASLDAYAALVVTEARCQQGSTLLGEVQSKNIPAFIKWIVADVEKECKAELEQSGLNPQDANKAISNAARNWYLAQTKKL